MSFWTLRFLRRYARLLPLSSLVRYRDVLIRERRAGLTFEDEVTLELRAPYRTHITFRPMSNDFYTLEEIFLAEVYRRATVGLPPGARVVDAGANIGLATVYLAARLRGSRILAVEPEPRNFALLDRNTRALAAAGRCTLLRAGIWDRDEELRVSPVLDSGEFNQQTVAELRQPADEWAVPGLTPGSLVEASAFERVDLFKIDVEGAESRLFRENDWLDRVDRLAIEFHDDSRLASGFDGAIARHGLKVVEGTSEAHTVVAERSRV